MHFGMMLTPQKSNIDIPKMEMFGKHILSNMAILELC